MYIDPVPVILPWELHLTILDFVEDDKTLCASSLVCKSWLSWAQKALYSTIEANVTKWPILCRSLTSNPTLGKHIRELALQDLPLSSIHPPHNLHIQNVRTLRIVDMDTASPIIMEIVSHCKHSIERLSLRDTSSPNEASFMSLLTTLPMLKHVDLCNNFFRSPGLPSTATLGGLSIPSNMRSLRLICDPPGFGPTCFVAQALFRHLRFLSRLSILTIRVVPGDAPLFARFLEAVGGNLLELNVGFTESVETELFRDNTLSLSACPNLRLFGLHLKLWRAARGFEHLTWVPALLSTVRATRMKRFKLAIRAQHARLADLSVMGLDKIDNVLKSDAFASLQRVLVRIVEVKTRTGVQEYIEGQLNGLVTRGLLSLHVQQSFSSRFS
ncbi:uncharacterized protein BXZ73DRAFT_47314 [Epithele typhae]|uniref:uncharacterized protein n=1 Tax=Epithele typhae TaxID=378194 RepID=UPI0020083A28|nr:uncharacterized protein BXZ73DRAFT_47314 [Epithele typhae]KAH9931072.1 hypothetical protein BXZ73DRAFT_47314 [Epithele typhae]